LENEKFTTAQTGILKLGKAKCWKIREIFFFLPDQIDIKCPLKTRKV
jgi:hypothetical protein